jgi:hypothetical protein
MRLDLVERGEDLAHGRVIGLLRPREPRPVDPVVDVPVDARVPRVDLVAQVGRRQVRPPNALPKASFSIRTISALSFDTARSETLSHRSGTVIRPV